MCASVYLYGKTHHQKKKHTKPPTTCLGTRIRHAAQWTPTLTATRRRRTPVGPRIILLPCVYDPMPLSHSGCTGCMSLWYYHRVCTYCSPLATSRLPRAHHMHVLQAPWLPIGNQGQGARYMHVLEVGLGGRKLELAWERGS